MNNTIRLKNNKPFHFRPIVDLVRIYRSLIRFGLSSVTSGLIDFLLVITLQYLTKNLLLSVVTARVCSSIFNYVANKTYVFARTRNQTIKASAVKYFSLVAIILACNYGLMFLLTHVVGLNLILSKLLTELILFTLGYKIQRNYIFKP